MDQEKDRKPVQCQRNEPSRTALRSSGFRRCKGVFQAWIKHHTQAFDSLLYNAAMRDAASLGPPSASCAGHPSPPSLACTIDGFSASPDIQRLGGPMKVTARIAIASIAVTLLATSAMAQAQYRGFPKSPTSPISQHYREEGKDNVELQKVPPIHMFDNVWYVGPGYVSCYLIKTSAGSILVDASEEPAMTDHVIDSI